MGFWDEPGKKKSKSKKTSSKRAKSKVPKGRPTSVASTKRKPKPTSSQKKPAAGGGQAARQSLMPPPASDKSKSPSPETKPTKGQGDSKRPPSPPAWHVSSSPKSKSEMTSLSKSTISSDTSPRLLSNYQGQKIKLRPPAILKNSLLDLRKELAAPHLVACNPTSNIFDRVFDCVALLIHCPTHQNVAVAKSPTGALWLPYVSHLTATQKPWYDAAREALYLVLSGNSAKRHAWLRRNAPHDQIQLVDFLRIQLPHTRKFVLRLIFYVRLKPPATLPADMSTKSKNTTKSTISDKAALKPFICCQHTTPSLIWAELDFLTEGSVENLWGPELVLYCQLLQDTYRANGLDVPNHNGTPLPQVPLKQSRPEEFGADQLAHFLTESYVDSLKLNDINERDVERLYRDFLDHCFPCFGMTYDSCRNYFLKTGIERSNGRIREYFRTGDVNQEGFIGFKELLHLLICLERNTAHVEFRIRFVFNYYDREGLSALTFENVISMVRDMAKLRTDEVNRNLSQQEADRHAKAAMAKFNARPDPQVLDGREPVVTFDAFKAAITGHAFRGTSALCRSRKNIFSHIQKRIAAKTIRHTQALSVDDADGGRTPVNYGQIYRKTAYEGSCPSCSSRRYRVASHLTTLSEVGYFLRTAPLVLSSESTAEALYIEQSLQKDSDDAEEDDDKSLSSKQGALPLNLVEDTQSYEFSPAYQLLTMVREFGKTQFQGSRRESPIRRQLLVGLMSSTDEDRDQLVTLVRTVVDALTPIVSQEARCRQVPSPTIIIGDIHGNLQDLLSMERVLWKAFPELNGMQYLFLGDYVDRGRFSVECALYLFSLKLLRPASVVLLRGNHEVRDIQFKYTYRNECLVKYGEVYGAQIFELTNQIFNHLPVCAVAGESVYCAHGGIPYTAQTIADINKAIPVEMPAPELDSQVAWEILWSDPVTLERYRTIKEQMDKEVSIRSGYLFNSKRGTAFFFSDTAMASFLATNGLTHIVRGHEVPKQGFFFHFQMRCTTIFSCSHYCFNENDAAVVLLQDGRLRILCIDTSTNASATDGIVWPQF